MTRHSLWASKVSEHTDDSWLRTWPLGGVDMSQSLWNCIIHNSLHSFKTFCFSRPYEVWCRLILNHWCRWSHWKITRFRDGRMKECEYIEVGTVLYSLPCTGAKDWHFQILPLKETRRLATDTVSSERLEDCCVTSHPAIQFRQAVLEGLHNSGGSVVKSTWSNGLDGSWFGEQSVLWHEHVAFAICWWFHRWTETYHNL